MTVKLKKRWVHYRIYNSWNAMRLRCTLVTHRCYNRYGGRGILICQRWSVFANFHNDMGDRPDGTTLDRIDNDGNYSCGKCDQCISNGWPANCRWANPFQQGANASATVKITLGDITDTREGWATRTGLTAFAIKSRIRSRWSIEDALTVPPQRIRLR